MQERKKFNMSGIDTVTLDILYNIKLYRISEIAEITGKTRQRVWQILKQTGLHNKSRVTRECLYCHKSFEVVRSKARNHQGKYCNEKCYHEHRRSIGNHDPNRQGQRIGRKVVETWLGHPLPEKMIVHHEDGVQSNNDIDNLIVFRNQSEHVKYHHAKRNGNAVRPYQELWELPNLVEGWIKS